MKLRLASNFSLPAEAVTETFAILAKRGVGKTYTAKKLAEEMLKAAIAPVIIADPVGVWWGLRSDADGKGPGLPVLVLGGDYGDAPLEAAAGEIVARMLVEERLSAVLDLSRFRKNEQTQFMTAFSERLYHDNREALHLMLDEADAFAPQKPYKGQERLLGAIEDLVRRGRARGIGVTLITQRAAVINKDVLTQAEVLIALRTIAPQDRAAIEAWIRVHGTQEQGDALMTSLPSLPVGTAWFWSPGWLDVFQRVEIERIETFDSSATPKAGKAAKRPKALAEVDIPAVREKLASTIEKAKAEDPKLLRAEVARLQNELRKAQNQKPAAPDPQVTLERESQIRKEAARSVHQQYGEVLMEIAPAVDALNRALNLARSLAEFVDTITEPKRTAPRPPAPPSRQLPAARVVRKERTTEKPAPAGDLTGPERRILNAIAWLESIGVEQPQQTAVAFLAGYTYGGGGFNNPRGALRTKGLLDYVGGERITLTDAGRQLAEYPQEALTSEELQRRVLERLPGPERRILEVILDAHPDSISNEDCADKAGYKNGGGGFNNPRGRLRTLGLIEYPQGGYVRAKDLLFLEGSRP